MVWKSKDFLHWSFEGTYFPSAEHEKYWAPSKAVQRKGKWYIYPTVNHYMHVGVADSPDGPFRLARGDERYEYYYMMSRTSPLGPYETPTNDLVSTTDVSTGVFGPGHGCVFNDGDNYYFAFLEFGRRSTNRQTYVNRLEFNDDGTIRQVRVTMDGVGALRRLSGHRELKPVAVKASSTRDSLKIRHNQDERCQRTEYLDGEDFIEFGQYQLSWGYYSGDRIGIYCYNDLSENGFIDVDYLLNASGNQGNYCINYLRVFGK